VRISVALSLARTRARHDEWFHLSNAFTLPARHLLFIDRVILRNLVRKWVKRLMWPDVLLRSSSGK
jgi:hypothetical protein